MEAFSSLNLAWIEGYFWVENKDKEVFSDPEKYIIQTGGEIFFALEKDLVIGTCALIPAAENSMELGKMAVNEKYQNKGIGRRIIEHCILWCKEKEKEEIELITSSKLAQAIHLYEKMGFRIVPFNDGELVYERGDVKMKLEL